ncbi:MAG: 3-hydroxyacyl-[acyl-carrier-protein] dehydratase FabZ [Desulfobacterales bacterium]|nr:MAG: 3-hydroxyacyl-[acyl-carrier-protein] dehydratase FabZ [Desulfobacterales bacterium]
MEDIVVKEDINIMDIMRLLPHRYPFLLVDRIISLIPGKSICGIKNVTINEPFFQGHFPQQPVMPGVLMLEGMAQTGGCMAYYTKPELVGEKLIYFAGINKARFKKPVIPGDQVIYKLELVKQKRSIIVMNARGYVSDTIVAEAELMASFN